MEGKHEAARAPRKNHRRSGTGMTALKVLGTLLAIGVCTALMFFGIFMKYVHTTLEPVLDVDMSAITLNQSSVIYYQDKSTGEWKELQKIHGTEDRTNIEFSDIPDHVWQALVSIEDQRFFQHHGVDWKSTGKAVFTMLTGGGTQRGGSTITQQVIKNATGNNQPTIKRKVTEIFQALRFYKNYSREETLTFYLNLVYFGNHSYGIQAAAENYFGKDAKDLTVAEGAAIVGITQYPYLYDPSRQGTLDSGKTFREKNKERQETVLDKMHELGYLDDAEYEAAVNEPLVFVWDDNYVPSDSSKEKVAETVAEEFDPYLVEQVFNDVVDALHREKNYSEEIAKKLLYTGGYQIYATIDPELQSIVEKVYADTSNLPYTSSKGEQLQSGMTVIDNATGNIVAMAGRVGEREGRFLFNYATATRPCGSAIKPIAVYAPALDTGVITPATVLDDYPVRLQANENGTEKAWPKNSYSGYKGLITLQTALRVSTNTTAVRVLEALSPSVSYDFMTQNLGFTTLVNSDLNSAALGLGGLTYGVNTVEMAAAYSAFANNGVYTRPRTYIEVRDNKGNLVLENKQESWVAMKESTAYSINELLKGVVRSGTGTEAAFSGMTIAGKTGTAQFAQDGIKYSDGYYLGTMVLYFPADEPKYTVLTAMFTRRGRGTTYYGAGLSGPVEQQIVNYIYNRQREWYGRVEETDDAHYARTVKGGDIAQIRRVADKLSPRASFDHRTGWGRVQVDSLSNVVITSLPAETGTMPDVRGMGLKDALFVLESRGLKVRFSGRGAVVRQSVAPGARITPGATVAITLN